MALRKVNKCQHITTPCVVGSSQQPAFSAQISVIWGMGKFLPGRSFVYQDPSRGTPYSHQYSERG